MREEIVLAGPVAVGKTSVAGHLGRMLNRPVVSMDDHRVRYYMEIGYDPEFAARLLESQGPASLWCYVKAFDPYSVERLTEEFSDCIFDLGGGSTVHEHDDQLNRVKRALAPFRNIVLLIPAPDPAESLSFLNERTGWNDQGRNINRNILVHRSNSELATFTIYTKEKTVDQIASEILSVTGTRSELDSQHGADGVSWDT